MTMTNEDNELVVAEPQAPNPLRFRDHEDGGLEQVTTPEDAAGAVQRMFGVTDHGTTLGDRLLCDVMTVVAPVHAAVAANMAVPALWIHLPSLGSAKLTM